MQLCLDATRFGFGLKEAAGVAISQGIAAFTFTFEPFVVSDEETKTLAKNEERFLVEVYELCESNNVKVAGLNVDYCLNIEDSASADKFKGMVKKLACVVELLKAPCLGFHLKAGSIGQGKAYCEEALSLAIELLAEKNVKLVMRLSTPKEQQGRSLSHWRPMDPQSWRDVICRFPGICLSFSPADWLWQGIDYLKLLPAFIPVIEQIEAVDVEINHELILDSGLFGPLWWRYRLPGRGQVDWSQLIEALKLYGYDRWLSIRLDDEFVDDDVRELERAVEASLRCIAPLVKE